MQTCVFSLYRALSFISPSDRLQSNVSLFLSYILYIWVNAPTNVDIKSKMNKQWVHLMLWISCVFFITHEYIRCMNAGDLTGCDFLHWMCCSASSRFLCVQYYDLCSVPYLVSREWVIKIFLSAEEIAKELEANEKIRNQLQGKAKPVSLTAWTVSLYSPVVFSFIPQWAL